MITRRSVAVRREFLLIEPFGPIAEDVPPPLKEDILS